MGGEPCSFPFSSLLDALLACHQISSLNVVCYKSSTVKTPPIWRTNTGGHGEVIRRSEISTKSYFSTEMSQPSLSIVFINVQSQSVLPHQLKGSTYKGHGPGFCYLFWSSLFADEGRRPWKPPPPRGVFRHPAVCFVPATFIAGTSTLPGGFSPTYS